MEGVAYKKPAKTREGLEERLEKGRPARAVGRVNYYEPTLPEADLFPDEERVTKVFADGIEAGEKQAKVSDLRDFEVIIEICELDMVTTSRSLVHIWAGSIKVFSLTDEG